MSQAILIIDDSLTFREQLREALEAAGYSVLTAESGEQGLAIASNTDIDAFIVDNVLPGIDGEAVVRHLRQEVRHRRAPSLLLTASEDPGQELEALQAGADAFVRKDESVEVLLARLAAVLRSVGRPARDGTHAPPRRSSVLFVDARGAVAQEAARTLLEEGVAVQIVNSSALAPGDFDCIVMDVSGAQEAAVAQNGAVLIRQVRAMENTSPPRVILVGKSESSSELVNAIATGADDYLPYSAGAEVLKARVRAQLRRKQLEDENEQVRGRIVRDRMELDAQRQIAAARYAMAEELRVARDLAERKAGEAAELLAQNEAVFSSMTEGLIISDLNGALVHVNQSAMRIYGAAGREEFEELFLCRSDICEMKTLEGKSLPLRDWPMASALRGESHSGSELAFFRRDTGHTFVGSFNAVPVNAREGQHILAAVTVRDITLQKQSEDVLRRTEKLAATGRLAASIAHEINNPLAAVTNLLWLLQDTVRGNPQAEEFLGTAQKELRRVAQITKQTLAFYRESNTPTEVDVCTLAVEVADIFSAKLRDLGLALRTELDCDLHPRAFAGELRQVISNLVSNAIDASPPGSVVRLRVRKARHGILPGVRISVADSGRGIPHSFYPEIFKPFSSSKGGQGTGLGLWVTQSIVARHEGRICFYSSTRPEVSGTVFSVFIPLAPTIAGFRPDSISTLFREVGRELLAQKAARKL